MRRYGYDSQRHERRYMVVAAFDNEREHSDVACIVTDDDRARLEGIVDRRLGRCTLS